MTERAVTDLPQPDSPTMPSVLPFSTAKRQLTHEACLLLRAADAGVRVPAYAAMASAGHGTWLLAEEAIEGGTKPSAQLTDDELHALWTEIGTLHAARIAHRDLRQANLMLDNEGSLKIVSSVVKRCTSP